MTIRRYIAIVALVYLAIFVTVISLIGGFDLGNPDNLMRLWPVPIGAIAMAYLGTTTIIARFGNATGSIYFLPTVLHVFLVLAMGMATASQIWY